MSTKTKRPRKPASYLLPTKRREQAINPYGSARIFLIEHGWTCVLHWHREHPCHSQEVIKRVDALAHYIGRGKYDPANRGKRSRNRWYKAIDRVAMMLQSPDWWQKNVPEQFAIIDPPTFPGGVYHEVYFVKEGYLPLAEHELAHYVKLWWDDPDDEMLRNSGLS